MKSYDEIKEGMTIYLVDPIAMYRDDNYDESNPDGYTTAFQKAEVYEINSRRDEFMISIRGGQFDGWEIYLHPEQDPIEKILNTAEHKAMKNTEAKVWPKLMKLLPEIEALKERSADMEAIMVFLQRRKEK